MEIGTGIAIAGVCISLVMLVYRVLPVKQKNNPDGFCQEHSGVLKAIENIEKWLEGISKDVKRLLER